MRQLENQLWSENYQQLFHGTRSCFSSAGSCMGHVTTRVSKFTYSWPSYGTTRLRNPSPLPRSGVMGFVFLRCSEWHVCALELLCVSHV